MTGRSVNITTLFLGRLGPPKRFTSTSCTHFRQLPLLNQQKEKRKYVDRPCIETRGHVRCATRPGWPIRPHQRLSNIFKLRGWSGGAMVLDKLPVPGRPIILITVGQGSIALAVGAGGGWFGHFYSHLSYGPI